MPHSSGGGSHSGGYSSSSHSTSSSSSYRSSGGSHSGGYRSSSTSYGSSRSYGSGNTSHRTSDGYRSQPYVSVKQFAGSQRYVYYRSGKPKYVYSNYENLTREKHNGRLVFYIILVFLVIVGTLELFGSPQKLSNTQHRDILIEDTIGVIDDQAALEQSLQGFLDQTGIAPAVVTVTDERWNPYFTSMPAAALDLYVNRFDDEQHWLILYSQPETPDPAFLAWQWEGIAGDDTSGILTDEAADYFGNRLQKYLTNERIGVGDALIRAFDEAAEQMMNTSEYDESDIPAAVIMIVGLILLGLWRSGYWPSRKKRPADLPADAVLADTAADKPASKSAAEHTCAYCGGVLPKGAVKCPQCGAVRKAKA